VLDEAWGIRRTGPSPFTSKQVGVAVARLSAPRSRWHSLTGDFSVMFTRAPASGAIGGKRPRVIADGHRVLTQALTSGAKAV